jgi:N utilization substance protein A
MIIIDNLLQVANQIETERGVSKAILFEAIEQALIAACRKKYHEEADVRADLNYESGEVKLFIQKEIVEEVYNDAFEISQEDAKILDSKAKLGDTIDIPVDDPDFGRMAAQTAKQVIIQRIREAEKDAVFSEFQDKIGHIITGSIQRVENRNYLVNLGRTEAILNFREQIPGETFHAKDKIKVYLVDIERESRGNLIRISRTHPGFLKELFTIEIPEIADEIIEIMSVSREPGSRSKVAVKSNNPSIGAVGTCVGQMGGRIQSIIRELNNEKIDVLEWNEDPKIFIANALKPAKISQVIIENEEEKTATVVVPNDQLSLAIGKGGVNVRLSVKLTNWKLDILSEDEYNKTDSDSSKEGLSLVEKMALSKQEEAEENSEDAAAPEEASVETPEESVEEAEVATDDNAAEEENADAPAEEAVLEEAPAEETAETPEEESEKTEKPA